MNIAIVEDEQVCRVILSKLVENYFTEHDIHVDIQTFESGEDFLASGKESEWSILFLDIYMKKMNGVETGREFRKKNTSCVLIFFARRAWITCRKLFPAMRSIIF